jgi:hypothetical protein
MNRNEEMSLDVDTTLTAIRLLQHLKKHLRVTLGKIGNTEGDEITKGSILEGLNGLKMEGYLNGEMNMNWEKLISYERMKKPRRKTREKDRDWIGMESTVWLSEKNNVIFRKSRWKWKGRNKRGTEINVQDQETDLLDKTVGITEENLKVDMMKGTLKSTQHLKNHLRVPLREIVGGLGYAVTGKNILAFSYKESEDKWNENVSLIDREERYSAGSRKVKVKPSEIEESWVKRKHKVKLKKIRRRKWEIGVVFDLKVNWCYWKQIVKIKMIDNKFDHNLRSFNGPNCMNKGQVGTSDIKLSVPLVAFDSPDNTYSESKGALVSSDIELSEPGGTHCSSDITLSEQKLLPGVNTPPDEILFSELGERPAAYPRDMWDPFFLSIYQTCSLTELDGILAGNPNFKPELDVRPAVSR